MAQDSAFWGGQILGDAASLDLFYAPYTDDMFSDIWRKMFLRDRTTQGVVAGYENELEVTDAGGTTMRVATGIALVDGKFYENTVNVDNASSGNTVFWVVGLQKDFDAQEVRVFARGNYATAQLALDSLSQTEGVGGIWEIALATVVTDAAGNVDAVTDQRNWAFRRPTKKFFVPCVSLWDNTTSIDEHRNSITGWPMSDNVISWGFGDFIVPLDCIPGTDLTVKAIVESSATGDVYSRIMYRTRRGCPDIYNSVTTTPGLAAEGITGTNETSCIAEQIIASVEPGWIYTLQYYRDAVDALDTINSTLSFIGFEVEYIPMGL